jgi:hypothetical protein
LTTTILYDIIFAKIKQHQNTDNTNGGRYMARLHGNPHMNSIRIVMENGKDKKILYLFRDGKARDMTNGFGELYKFDDIYKKLISEGYKQTNKMCK